MKVTMLHKVAYGMIIAGVIALVMLIPSIAADPLFNKTLNEVTFKELMCGILIIGILVRK